MHRDIRRALVSTFVARTGANASLRIVYPFLPAIARGLNVSPGTIASFIALRNLGGLTTPLIAGATERLGRRTMMVAGMVGVTAGAALTAVSPSVMLAGVGIVIVGLSKYSFDLPMQSWFGDRVPYAERGRVFGITELTWSVALLFVPIAGLLIEATSWRAPFVMLSIFSALGAVAVARGIDSDRPAEHVSRRLPRDRRLFAMVPCILLFSAAAEIPFIVYGQWLEGSFGLSVAGIGAFTLAIVVAELIGEGAVTVVADRFGLRTMWLWGLIVSAVAYLAFPLADSLVVAVVVVVVWIAAFEITIVAAIPFVSEIAPTARERMLSVLAISIAIGRTIGALVAQPLYREGGIGLAGTASAILVALATVLLLTIPDHES